jgi:hypothetical protein
MKQLCHSCEQKIIVCNTNKNIWDFNPYIYETYKELKEGFKKFYKLLYSNDNDNFYSCFNDDGYTYTQWYVYIIGKNMYKYRNLKKKTFWMFQVFSSYDFFTKLIKLGRHDDKLHNTLHHFLKYLDNMGKLERLTIELLISNGLKMEDIDNEGYSCNDYLNQKTLSEEDLLKTKSITSQYKKTEEGLFMSYDVFKNFSRCDMCNDFINKFDSLLVYKDLIKVDKDVIDIVNKIKDIIEKRMECINIYLKYENCINSTERHIYVINVYKDFLSYCDHCDHCARDLA